MRNVIRYIIIFVCALALVYLYVSLGDKYEEKRARVAIGAVTEATATHWAKVDENGVVQQVIVADQAFIQSGAVGNGWIPTEKGNNYANRGYTYDSIDKLFYPPKPYPSWVKNNQTATWEAPVAIPNRSLKEDQIYDWNEPQQKWEVKTIDNRDPITIWQESL